jgi:hypothetical protein
MNTDPMLAPEIVGEETGRTVDLARIARKWRSAQESDARGQTTESAPAFRTEFASNIRVAETQSTDDFLHMADLLDREVLRGASANTVRTTYQVLSRRRDAKTFEIKSLKDLYGSMLAAAEIPPGGAYPEWSAADAAYTLRVQKRGWRWPLTMEAWLRDSRDLGLLSEKMFEWGQASAYTREWMFTSLWAANFTYFAAGNSNFANSTSTPWYIFADPNIRPAVVYGQIQGWPDYEILMHSSEAQSVIGGGEDMFGFSNDSVDLKFRFTAGFCLGHPSAAYRSEEALNYDHLNEAVSAFKAIPDPAGNVNAYLGKMYLVVPPSLAATAANLVASQSIVMAGTAGAVTVMGNSNPYANRLEVVVNDFLASLDITG